MPTIRANNAVDPSQIASMFDPIAAAFKPPSGQEILAGAKSREVNQKVQMLQDLYAAAGGADVDQARLDRQAAIAGVYSPNQSLTAVDRNNANARAIDAADNARALQQTGMQQTGENARNANTVRGSTISSLYGPLSLGQVRPAVPDDVSRTVGLPAIAAAQGLPKPVTQDEVAAQALASLATPQQRLSVALKGVGNTEVQGADGRVTLVPNDQAVGMTPAPKQAEPKYFNYDLPDGKTGTAYTGPDGGLYDTQSRERLPQGLKTYTAQLSGSKADTGLSAGVTSGLQQRRIDLQMLKSSSAALRKLATEHPEAIGTTGSVLGLGQNILATGGELASLMGPKAQQYLKEAETGALPPEMRTYFNPKIPEAQMIENTLLAQYAKILDPGGRLSDQRMKQAAEAMGVGGTLRSAKNTMSTLDALDNFIAQQQSTLDIGDPKSSYLNGGPATAAPVAPAAPGGQKVRRKWTADGQLQ